MKTLLVSVSLFLIMISLITVNAIYICNVSNALKSDILQLDVAFDEQCEEALKSISTYWNKNKRIISLSTNSTDVNKITDCISQLQTSAKNHCQTDFETSKQLLLNLIERMPHTEKITLSSII